MPPGVRWLWVFLNQGWTRFLVDIMQEDPRALALLDELEEGPDPLHVPSLVYDELSEGIERSTKPIRERTAVEETLESYPPVGLDPSSAMRAGWTLARLITKGERIGGIDLLIAGIALERREAVVTSNKKHSIGSKGSRS